MPPHGVIKDFLPQDLHDALLGWTIEQRSNFEAAGILYEGGLQHRVDPAVRVGLKHYGLGHLEPAIAERMLSRLPEIMAAAGYRGPEPRSLEFEITASGDGAHFAPHVDIPIGAGRRTLGKEKGEDRIISSVYYFHREPKGFSGGALRLYPFGSDSSQASDDGSIAFEPVQNSLLVFPSFARHSVEPVRCPSSEFGDYRFGLNCFFCRRLGS